MIRGDSSMSIIKCPVCKDITWIPGISDGDMVACTKCKSRFTIIPVRRIEIQQEENNECKEVKEFLNDLVKDMDCTTLLELIETISNELKIRNKY